MKSFQPNYEHVVNAARNIKPQRLPQCDFCFDLALMEKVLGIKFAHLKNSKELADRKEFAKQYTNGFRVLGYDTVDFEAVFSDVINYAQSLKGLVPGPIQNREDMKNFHWDELPTLYFKKFDETISLIVEALPEGMKAVGGVGTGIFESVQDLTRYQELCFMMYDDPELYANLFVKLGDALVETWRQFMKKYGEHFCVLRFGDDLGYKTSTLISEDDIKTHIIPQYARIVDVIHSYDRPFLYHSCGYVFNVLDDIIEGAKIDAKHSNEDAIAPFSEWVDKFSNKIGLFGGIDMNVLVYETPSFIKKYTREVIDCAVDKGGFACGSGNSLPDYIPPENYRAMIDTIQEYRNMFQ